MGCSEIEELDVSKWNLKPPADKFHFFSPFTNCTKLKKLDVRTWPINKMQLNGLFNTCTSLEEVLLPVNWLDGVTSLKMLFQNCSSLKNLDISNWDVSKITDMSFMFYGCSSLKEIDVSKWDVSKVKTFDHFAAHANLRRKGIENWNTSSCENMNAMFHNCAEEELDLSGFDTSKVKYFSQMFENSPNLKHIKGLDKWDTSSATGFDEMFGRCPKLEELDLSSWDTRKAKNGEEASTNGHTTGTFRNFCNDCTSLKWIKLGENFSINGDGTNTTEEYRLILPTPSYEGANGNWYTFNGDSYAPNTVKDKTAETYYGSYDMVANMDVICKNGSLIEIAKAIREKNGTTEHYSPAQFGDAIRALS
jgi:surface protein